MFKKILDRLLEIFMWVYEIFLYSIALKLFLGFMWILGDFYIWFDNLSWITQIIISVIVGLSLRTWRKNYIKNKEK